VGLKDRIRRLENRGGVQEPPACEECGGFIIYELIAEDGTVTYPHGEPCPLCDSRGSGGRIGRIVIDRRRPEDKPEDPNTFTLNLGEMDVRGDVGLEEEENT
jgi:hypothetical protein